MTDTEKNIVDQARAALVQRLKDAPANNQIPIVVYDHNDMADLIERGSATVIPSFIALDMQIEIEKLKAGVC